MAGIARLHGHQARARLRDPLPPECLATYASTSAAVARTICGPGRTVWTSSASVSFRIVLMLMSSCLVVLPGRQQLRPAMMCPRNPASAVTPRRPHFAVLAAGPTVLMHFPACRRGVVGGGAPRHVRNRRHPDRARRRVQPRATAVADDQRDDLPAGRRRSGDIREQGQFDRRGHRLAGRVLRQLGPGSVLRSETARATFITASKSLTWTEHATTETGGISSPSAATPASHQTAALNLPGDQLPRWLLTPRALFAARTLRPCGCRSSNPLQRSGEGSAAPIT